MLKLASHADFLQRTSRALQSIVLDPGAWGIGFEAKEEKVKSPPTDGVSSAMEKSIMGKDDLLEGPHSREPRTVEKGSNRRPYRGV